MIEYHEFFGAKSGPSLLLLGGVHGNEPCGVIAINKIIDEIKRRHIVIKTGRLICVPLCNERAFSANTRYSDENLNRVIRIHDNPTTYEQELANMIVPFIKSSDYVLDLHSQHVDGEAFCFVGRNESSVVNFAQATGAQFIITGWNDLYRTDLDYSTEDYAGSIGKIATTVECGGHQSSQSPVVAYNAIINIMQFLGMIEGLVMRNNHKTITMTEVVSYNGGKFAKDWRTFDPLYTDDIIALDASGNKIQAGYDGCIILPNPSAKIGEEWFYIGRYSPLE